ncbi:hypothetical protein SPHINGO8AM_20090 [Sphingomonas sp. 8AM]|nr:hypothetical protein SPHINGO8AM_20090 [Sphingomonas sp. 8AM]
MSVIPALAGIQTRRSVDSVETAEVLDPASAGMTKGRSVVLAAEIRRGVVLALIDDRPPDRAGARKAVVERVAVVPADRAL